MEPSLTSDSLFKTRCSMIAIRPEKERLESIINEIVDPFYQRIKEDNKVAAFLPHSEMLLKLKGRQSLFVIRFLTHSLQDLQNSMRRTSATHIKIDLKLEPFVKYYFLWSDLIITWLERHITQDKGNLELWQAKLTAAFSYMVKAYTGMTHDEALALLDEHPTRWPREQTASAEAIDRMHQLSARKTSARELLQDIEVDMELMDELNDLEQELVDTLFVEGIVNEALKEASIRFLTRYATLLNQTLEFKELAYVLNALVMVFDSLDIEGLEPEKSKRFLTLLESIIHDLAGWRKHVFIDQDARDIHYLDASLFSSCAQLEMMMSGQEEPRESELELF